MEIQRFPGWFVIKVGRWKLMIRPRFAVLRRRAGPVGPGTPYIVGERRAELFVPTVDGTIVPRVPTDG